MKKLLAILILMTLIGCDMGMRIDYDYQKTYTETFTRTVGATERTGVRGTLPQPAPSDANSIWQAPNGNDGAAGTQAAPKLTLNGANAALGGAKTTIHIFRNGYVGDLEFVETVATTLLSTHNIQVEDGEIATIEYPVLDPKLTLSGSNAINGIKFVQYENDINEMILIGANNVAIENCSFINTYVGTGSNYGFGILIFADPSGITIDNCYFNIGKAIFSTSGSTITISNSIFDIVKTEFNSPYGIFDVDSGGLIIGTSNISPNGTFTVNNCIFSNIVENSAGILVYGPTPNPAPGPTVNVTDSNFVNTTVAAEVRVNNLILNYDYCSLHGISTIRFWGSFPFTGVVVTNTNTIGSNTPNLFHNESLAISGDIESFRLQREGQSTPDGSSKYFITSPLVGAGLAGDDITPFDESVALASTAYNKSMDIKKKWINKEILIENLYTNPVSLTDVNGNMHKGYDKVRRRITMTWGADRHVPNMQVKELSDMLSDNGSKRFFPVGAGSSLFNESGSSNGVFLDTDNSLSPVDAAIVPMVDNYWRGLWIQIGSDRFYIGSNTPTKLILIDKLGAGYPANGSHAFLIDSILVNNKPVPFPYQQNNFTQFTKGGFLRESPEEVRAYDYTIEQIILEEIEDPEENI